METKQVSHKSDAMVPQRVELDGGSCFVQSLRGDQSSHLLVCGDDSILIDCHSADMARWIQHRRLPPPKVILHTHVQPEHCREGKSFPEARILVPEGTAELAGDPEAYALKSRTTWDHPEEWMTTFGREAYGIGGSVTQLPPQVPLPVAGTISPGDIVPFKHLQLRAVSLPGHGLNALGFILERAEPERRDDAVPLAFFCGDLLRYPATLVNMYDLETHYGGTALKQMPALLREAASVGAKLFFPATGPALQDGPRAARELADKIDRYFDALNWESGEFTPQTAPEYEQVGRYARVHQGIYQIANFGNCILFIDHHGRGMMVDPGPCDYDNRNRVEDFVKDLERFERECGLKTIERVLITHFHGDHYDLTPQVLNRYPNCRVVAWDLVARVIESPWDFPYACRLPWYKVGVDHVGVDDITYRGQPYFWNDVQIDSVHLPGHCHAHAGYLLQFNGKRIAITGDAIQSRGGSDTMNFIICNESVPDEKSGCLGAFETMLDHDVGLNLGGHGSHFTNCRALYKESLSRMRHVLPFLKELVPGGDVRTAFHRPWFPQMNTD